MANNAAPVVPAVDARQIAEEVEANAPYWSEAMEIPFWKEASQRTMNTKEHANIEEFFARWKIRPSWAGLEKLLTSQVAVFLPKSTDSIELETQLDKFLGAISQEVIKPGKSSKEIRKGLSMHESKLSASLLELFPPDFEGELHNLYKGLKTPDPVRKDMSEMSYDIMVFSSVFHRYFGESFRFSSNSNKSIKEYFPKDVAEAQEPDFVLYKDDSGKTTIFLICEYHEVDHATNHKDLLKLLDMLQSVLLKRVTRYPDSSNAAYGVLCGGRKMTMFRMVYNKDGYFTCYLLGKQKTDMYTALLDLANIDNLLRCCILITIEGKMLQLGRPKAGREPSSFGSKPSLVDSKAASVGASGKKKKTSKRRHNSSSSLEKKLPSSPSSSSDRDLRSNFEQLNLANNNTNNNNAMQTNQNNNNNGNIGQKEEDKKKQEQKDLLETLTKNKLCDKYIVLEQLARKVYRVGFGDRKYVAKFYFTSEAKSDEELILEQLSDRFLKPIDSFKVADGIRCVIFPYIENHQWTFRHQFVNSVRSVLLALAELHDKDIAHCDIKYSNVVFGKDETYLIDLDLALVNPDEWETSFRGTFGYRAPETVRTGDITCKSDIYSFGIFLFEVAKNTGIYYMESGDLADDDEMIMARNIRYFVKCMALRSPWHAEIAATIEKCMEENPELRPSARDLLNERFLSQTSLEYWPSQNASHSESEFALTGLKQVPTV